MQSNLSFNFDNFNIYNKEIFNIIIKTINICLCFVKKELNSENEKYFDIIKEIEEKENKIKLHINKLTKNIKNKK